MGRVTARAVSVGARFDRSGNGQHVESAAEHRRGGLAEAGRHDEGPGGSRGDRAVLRGPARPDLIRRETLASLFRASARERADAPCLIDAAAPGADGRPRS